MAIPESVGTNAQSDDVQGHGLVLNNVNETVESDDDVQGHGLVLNNVNETVESDDAVL